MGLFGLGQKKMQVMSYPKDAVDTKYALADSDRVPEPPERFRARPPEPPVMNNPMQQSVEDQYRQVTLNNHAVIYNEVVALKANVEDIKSGIVTILEAIQSEQKPTEEYEPEELQDAEPPRKPGKR